LFQGAYGATIAARKATLQPVASGLQQASSTG